MGESPTPNDKQLSLYLMRFVWTQTPFCGMEYFFLENRPEISLVLVWTWQSSYSFSHCGSVLTPTMRQKPLHIFAVSHRPMFSNKNQPNTECNGKNVFCTRCFPTQNWNACFVWICGAFLIWTKHRMFVHTHTHTYSQTMTHFHTLRCWPPALKKQPFL